jgi:hypothetical protein
MGHSGELAEAVSHPTDLIDTIKIVPVCHQQKVHQLRLNCGTFLWAVMIVGRPVSVCYETGITNTLIATGA